MLKQTPLNATHRAAGARMVDFGGWDMPVNYGSQIDEHHAVRRDAGMFDVSHMRAVDLAGAGARDFLRFALANNVDKLKEPGKALYSCLLPRHPVPLRWTAAAQAICLASSTAALQIGVALRAVLGT